MRVLVVKLTSMGDVLHLMPALTDFCAEHPDAKIDWMVEGSFSEIPKWHASVDRVIPVATRKWRKLSIENIKDFFSFLSELRSQQYDVVIDAQGLMKSASFARFAKLSKNGFRAGFSAASIKEKPAARLYSKKVDVARQQHAIIRLRELLAGVFDYKIPDMMDYALNTKRASSVKPQIVLLHGTTWQSKHLPDYYWRELATHITQEGYQVLLPWGNDAEKQRAEQTAEALENVTVLSKSTLTELAEILSESAGAIAVDTGLGHLAAALSVPTVSVYGSTDAQLTGAVGENQHHLQTEFDCSPCFLKQCDKLNQDNLPPCYLTVSPLQIWQKLQYLINQ